MKYLIISPKFFPGKDGLSEYTTRFFDQLCKEVGDERVSVLTSKGHDSFEGRPNIHPLLNNWNGFRFIKTLRNIGLYGDEEIIVQYVPFMYSRLGGINFSFPLALIYLRLFSKHRISIVAHELHYPMEPGLKPIIMFLSHVLMLYMLGISAHKLFATTEFFARRFQKMLGGLKKVRVLFVGSNIPVIDSETNDWRSQFSGEGPKVCLFGGLHPSKNVPLVLNSLAEVLRNGGKLQLIYIGLEQSELKEVSSNEDWSLLNSVTTATGRLEANQVSQIMSQVDIAINYFVDGISGRRGSALCPLEHGVPLITTFTEESDKIFLERSFVKILPVDDLNFKDKLVQFLLNSPEMDSFIHQKALARDFYLSHFSWEVIVTEYLKKDEDLRLEALNS